MLRLKPDWQSILKRAWSIRLIAIAAVLSGAEAVLYIEPDLIPVTAPTLALIVFGVTSAALIARIVAQKNLAS